MKPRLIEIGLFSIVSVGLSYYIGGYGLAFVFFVAIYLWLVFGTFDFLPGHLRFLGALILSMLLPVVSAVAFLPALARISWLRSFAFESHENALSDYISFDSSTLGNTRPHTFFLMIFLLSMVLTGFVALQKKGNLGNGLGQTSSGKFKLESEPIVCRYSALVPLIGLSYIEHLDRSKAIAFMMSGDSRNVFLTVMRLRMTSRYPNPINMVTGGQFGEVLTAVISTLNGVSGFPRKEDIYSMRSAYALVFVLISCSIAVYFGSRPVKNSPVWRLLRNLSVVAIVLVVILSPYPFGEILRSGFFSFNVSLGFLAAALAFLVPKTVLKGDVLLVATTAFALTYFSYQLTALLLMPLFALVFATYFWRIYESKSEHSFQLLTFIVTGIVIYFLADPFYERMADRVRQSGEIWPTDHRLVTLSIAAALPTLLFTRRKNRALTIRMTVVAISAFGLVRLIDFARAEDPDMYYLMKSQYAANFAMLLLWLLIIGAFLSDLTLWSRPLTSIQDKSLIMQIVKFSCLIVSLLAISIASFSIPQATKPISLIIRGWDVPNQEVVDRTFELWERNDRNYIYSQYFGGENDRLMNFWSPFLWEINRWNWTYAGDSNSWESICSVSGNHSVQIFSRSVELGKQITEECQNKKLIIRLGQSNDFDFSS
jgi:hypothetical protein